MNLPLRVFLVSVLAFSFGCVSGTVSTIDQMSKKEVRNPNHKSPEEILRTARKRVFKVIVETAGGKGGGTAFLVQGQGGNLILTNKHICESYIKQPAHIYLEQGDKRYFTKVETQSNVTDLCLLALPEELSRAESYTLADQRPRENEPVFTIGHPFLHPLTEIYGEYKNEDKLDNDPMEKFDLQGIPAARLRFGVVPGCSGSPVVNREGKLVGVIFAYDDLGGLMIPLSSVKEFLRGH